MREFGSDRLFPGEEIQNRDNYGPGIPGAEDLEIVFVMGGTDDNGNTVRTEATLSFRDR